MVSTMKILLIRKIGSHAYPDSKVHGANMRPIWGRQDLGGPHVGPMNFVIWVPSLYNGYPGYPHIWKDGLSIKKRSLTFCLLPHTLYDASLGLCIWFELRPVFFCCCDDCFGTHIFQGYFTCTGQSYDCSSVREKTLATWGGYIPGALFTNMD